jgi:hypothetical protein
MVFLFYFHFEPHRHIAHIRNTHIGFIMNAILCETLCFYVPMWFKLNLIICGQKKILNELTYKVIRCAIEAHKTVVNNLFLLVPEE